MADKPTIKSTTFAPSVPEPLGEKEQLQKRILEIEREYNGNLSDISFTHEYWNLQNNLRGLKK